MISPNVKTALYIIYFKMLRVKLFPLSGFLFFVIVAFVHQAVCEHFLKNFVVRSNKGINIEIRDQLVPVLVENVMQDGNFSEVNKFLIINCSLTEIKPKAFKGKIRELTIQNNALRTLRDDIFEEEIVVNFLNLNRNGITLIEGGVFRNVLHLTRVDISENLIKHLDENVLANPFIRTLVLKENLLEHITSKMFQNLPRLETLFLDDNKISAFETGSFSLSGLSPYLSLRGNQLENITNKIVSSAKSSVNVDLSNNKIKNLSRGAFTKIRHLNLNGNQLEHISAGLFSSTEIKTLNLSNNKVNRISKGAFVNSVIFDLSLKCNNLEDIPESFLSLELGRLDLSNNQINRIPKGAFTGSTILILRLDNNNLVNITSEMFDEVTIQTVVLSGNQISSIEQYSFDNIRGLKHLGLIRNKLRVLKKSVFANSSLRKIFLDFNNISRVEWGVFDNLQNLETVTIDLSKLDNFSKNNVLCYDSNYYEYYDAAVKC